MPSAGGRIGGQFDAGPAKMAVYLGANYVHEFKGQDNVTFASGGQTLGLRHVQGPCLRVDPVSCAIRTIVEILRISPKLQIFDGYITLLLH